MAPIVADAEAGFGGALNAYELMKAMIEAGAAGVHFEDQLASEKKCGHLGGKVLVPISQHIRTLNAARLAADVEGVPTVLLCRTDAECAQLLTSDVDERDRPFISSERTAEGFFRIRPGCGMDYAIARSLAYAPYADLLWWETTDPDLDDARALRRGDPPRIPRQDAGLQLLARPSTGAQAGVETIAKFQREIGAMGYKFQFVTLAGFHSLNLSMFKLARGYAERGMGPTANCSRPSSPPRPRASPRRGTSARSASATSTPSPPRPAAASPAPRRWRPAPRRPSSTTKPRRRTDAPAPGKEHPMSHDNYDDGLVHSHRWATEPPTTFATARERGVMVGQGHGRPSGGSGWLR